jgi:hypothetical protein
MSGRGRPRSPDRWPKDLLGFRVDVVINGRWKRMDWALLLPCWESVRPGSAIPTTTHAAS